MKLQELLKPDMDLIKYDHSGKEWEGYVKEVNDNHIIARVYDTAESGNVSKFHTVILYKQTFRGLNLQFWFDGQGCDNSAIGISGHWDSLADFVGA